jgi:hypothetical protein
MGPLRTERILFSLASLLCLTLSLSGNATAGSVTYSGSSGQYSASAVFTLTGSTLTIDLTNTSSADVLVPSDVLMAVLFNTSNLLTPVSASLNGSTVFYGSLVNNVGEGWAYNSGFSAHGMNSGISAAGLGIFGPNGNFFLPGVKVDGLDYGLLSKGDNPSTGNSGVKDHGPLIKNSVLFTLLAAPGFSLTELGNLIVFQNGTELDEPFFNGTLQPISEPGALALLVPGLVGLGFGLRRKLIRA